jgi:tRNA(adenine34) deaminase
MIDKSNTNTDPMEAAFEQACRAEMRGEVPVGAVLVDGDTGTILAAQGNRVEELTDPTAHAEILIIRIAAKLKQSLRLFNCDLYVTLEPCPMCAQAISLARIRRLFFAAYDTKGGGVDHGPRIYSHTTCHHAPEVIGGVREQQAAKMLQAFFKTKR